MYTRSVRDILLMTFNLIMKIRDSAINRHVKSEQLAL